MIRWDWGVVTEAPKLTSLNIRKDKVQNIKINKEETNKSEVKTITSTEREERERKSGVTCSDMLLNFF